MKPQELRAWRKRHGLTQAAAGELLDRSAKTIGRLEEGDHDVPAVVAFACEGIELSGVIAANKSIILNLLPRAGDAPSRAFLRYLLKVEPVIDSVDKPTLEKAHTALSVPDDAPSHSDAARATLAVVREQLATGRIDERRAILELIDTMCRHGLVAFQDAIPTMDQT